VEGEEGKRTQKRHEKTYLIWAAMLLHNILRPVHVGVTSEIKLLMTAWIQNIKVGTVIQSADEVVLPSE